MKLIFVYNADSGLFNTMADMAHKLFSPKTYQCDLCSLTHDALHVKKAWKQYIASLPVEMEFLHRDQYRAQFAHRDLRLPVILACEQGHECREWISATQLHACKDVHDLMALIDAQLGRERT